MFALLTDLADNAAVEAEQVGKNSAILCATTNPFHAYILACESCIYVLDTSTVIPDFQVNQFITYCNFPPISLDLAAISSSRSSIGSSASWCADYNFDHGSSASNCTTATSTPLAGSSTAPVTPGRTSSHAIATHSTSPAPVPHHLSKGGIAGAVIGGVVGTALVLLAAFLVIRLRRKRRANRLDEAHEKPQLHSEDFKPDRNELQGTKASQTLLEKKGFVAELPANEDPLSSELTGTGVSEMTTNEDAGHEMETTENEMKALDRLVGTGGTAVGNGEAESRGTT